MKPACQVMVFEDQVHNVCQALADNDEADLALQVLQKLYDKAEISHEETQDIADNLKVGVVQ